MYSRKDLQFLEPIPLDEEDIRVLQELDLEPVGDGGVDGGGIGGGGIVSDAIESESTGELTLKNYHTQLVRVAMIVMLLFLTLLIFGLGVGALVEMRTQG